MVRAGQESTVAVQQTVGRVAAHLKELLYQNLLLGGQIVVHAVGASQIILLDDTLPCAFSCAAGKIQIYYVKILELLLEFMSMLQILHTRMTP